MAALAGELAASLEAIDGVVEARDHLGLPADDPLWHLPNVLVTPHALCWTDECFDAIAREGLACLVDFAQGRTPRSVVRP